MCATWLHLFYPLRATFLRCHILIAIRIQFQLALVHYFVFELRESMVDFTAIITWVNAHDLLRPFASTQ